MKAGLKIILVIMFAAGITAVGIDATDTLSGKGGTLLGQLIATDESGGCPAGMIAMQAPTTFTCVDQYEASPSEACNATPTNGAITKQLLEQPDCTAASVAGATPWTHITRDDAVLACSKSGKRLPTVAEWYQVALGTPVDECNVQSSGYAKTGGSTSCVSSSLAYDAVGNVWEWTTADVFDGTLDGRPVPNEGYVAAVDSAGVATETSDATSIDFGSDYFWSESTGTYALMRGGFYGSREDAGVFTVHAATKPVFTGAAVGFRCVK